MGRALTADLMFSTAEAAAFRSDTLAGSHLLDVDELCLLGDELHACARARCGRQPRFGAYGSSEPVDVAPIFDRRL